MLSRDKYFWIFGIVIVVICIYMYKSKSSAVKVQGKSGFVKDTASTSSVEDLVNTTINTINNNATTGITTVLNECLAEIQSNNISLEKAAQSACNAQISTVQTSNTTALQNALQNALISARTAQDTAVSNAIASLKSVLKYNAPNFQAVAGNSTGTISFDGNTILWSDGSIYKRITPVSSGQDPTILDYNNSIPSSQMLDGYTSPLENVNWYNTNAKWGVSIKKSTNQSQSIGTSYELNVNGSVNILTTN